MLINEGAQSQQISKNLIEQASNIQTIGHIAFAFKSEVQAWKDLLLRGSTPENFKKYEGELLAKSTSVKTMTTELKNHLRDDEGKNLADKFLTAEAELYSNYQKAKDTFLLPGHFDYVAADAKVKGKDRPVTESLTQLNAIIEKQMQISAEASSSQIGKQIKLGFGIALVVTLFVTTTTWIILKKISTNLKNVTHSLEEVSSNIDGAVVEISQASEQLASANTEAATSVEKTSASIEEITSMLKRSSDLLTETNLLAANGNQTAQRGEKEMSRLNASMTQIQSSSTKMEEIISVIDDIAFQTNLLSLNASVEAARAGEQGKGFAVVAEAVRSLAQRSAVSAKDISLLIKDSVAKIEEGAKIASGTEFILKDIASSVKQISNLTGDVTAMSSQQLAGVEQISKALYQLDQTAQVNADSSEKTAGTSLQMKEQSQTLINAMNDLRKVVEG